MAGTALGERGFRDARVCGETGYIPVQVGRLFRQNACQSYPAKREPDSQVWRTDNKGRETLSFRYNVDRAASSHRCKPSGGPGRGRGQGNACSSVGSPRLPASIFTQR